MTPEMLLLILLTCVFGLGYASGHRRGFEAGKKFYGRLLS